jgi:acetaldehyde dehydrogenase (acetylating)
MDTDLQSIQESRQLVEAAYMAWKSFEGFSEAQVEPILRAVSDAGVTHATRLAELAVQETGFGNVADKTAKNLFGAKNVYDAMVPLRTIGIVSEDNEKKVLEVACPVGVVAGIVPSTNPTSTTIYKILIALKGRNAIVFSPHPSAVRCITETVSLLAAAAEAAGAPPGIVSSLSMPTMQATQELMRHPKTALILATGGPGLVRAAYSAGKPAFGVGPGNVPAYVERSADVRKAVADILTGKCFDNGTLCSSEQALIADDVIGEQVLAELQSGGAYVCRGEEKTRLEKTIQNARGTLNTGIVGQSAVRIAEMARIKVPPETRALVAEADGVGPEHPLSMEKLSPILAFYTVRDWREGCKLCIEILTFGGLGHSLGLHSNDDEVIRQFALQKPASRICVNTPAALGAVGYTTNLFPSMTLGCGAFGGNITSDNISPLHLINLKRVAYGVRDAKSVEVPADSGRSADVAASSSGSGATRRDRITAIVDGWLDRQQPITRQEPEAVATDTSSSSNPAEGPLAAPPLESYDQIEERLETFPIPSADPVEFVCEDDVRAASRANQRIGIDAKTIITPSARDLGEQLDIFLRID